MKIVIYDRNIFIAQASDVIQLLLNRHLTFDAVS